MRWREVFCSRTETIGKRLPRRIVFGLPEVIGKNWSRISLDSQVKRELLNAAGCDVLIGGLSYPLALALGKTAQSLADVALGRGTVIQFPEFT